MTAMGNKAAAGFIWMLAGSVAQQTVSFMVTVVLARLLTPADFGAVAILMGIITILLTFAELGLSVALVQRKELPSTTIDSAFVCVVAFTVIIVAALMGSSGSIATFYDAPILEPLMKLLAISYIARGLFSIYNCLLLRHMRYRHIALVNLTGNLTYGFVAILLALFGWGPYSLVLGHTTAGVAILAAGVWLTRYVPRSFGKRSEMSKLLSFGFWVSAGRALNSGAGQFDAFLIGKILDISSLGVYSLAQKLILLVPATLTSIVDQVMLPIYSRWQETPDRVENAYWSTLQYISYLALPPVVMVAVFAEFLVPILFGDQWSGAIPLIRIMAIFAATQCLGGGLFGAVIYATGRPKIMLVVNGFRVIALPSCIFVASTWGVIGVAWGFSLYALIGRLFNQTLLTYIFGFSFVSFFRAIWFPVILNAAGGIAGFTVIGALADNSFAVRIWGTIVVTVLWLVAYVAILAWLVPDQLQRIKRLVWPPTRLFAAER